MKSTKSITIVLAVVVMILPAAVWAQSAGSAFTYQGQLTDLGLPANGTYDFQFTLYDDRDGRIAGPIDVEDLMVSNGLFSVVLDFGTTALSGEIRMLEIAVRPGESIERHEVLTPRQELTPTPYASTALKTVGVDGHSLDAEDGFPTDVVFTDREGNVGVGTRSPAHQLHVVGLTGPAVVGENLDDSSVGQLGSENGGVFGEEAGPGGTGVYGRTDSGIGVYGEALAGVGVEGYTFDPNGVGLHGQNEADSGNAIAVWGETGSPDGYGGYFAGRGYFSGNVGIGTTPTDSSLTVAGTIESSTGGFLFPDGTMQTTAATGGGGGGYWIPSSSGIFYDEGYVGVGVEYPAHSLHAVDPVTTAIGGECVGEGTRGYLGHESAAVYGELAPGSLAYGGWFGGKGYFADAVGIGTTPEGAMLVVEGLIDCTADGVRFPDGTIQTSAATGGGGGSYWEQQGTDLYYDNGSVGIGIDTPDYALHVIADAGTAVWGESPSEGTVGYLGGEYAGVYGEVISGDAVYGYTLSPSATAVHGHNEADSGTGVAILGETSSPDGFGGYFLGRGYFSNDVGIGTDDAATRLHVVDPVDTAVTGRCELEGSTGYLGHVDAGVYGISTLEGGTNYGVRGEVLSGRGVYGEVTGTGGQGVYGLTVNGTGVYGEASAPDGSGKGVSGFVASPDGVAVYGFSEAEAGNAVAIKGETVSPDGAAVYGYSPLEGGNPVAIKGETLSANGYAGYFLGRGYFRDYVGVGTTDPQHPIHVIESGSGPGIMSYVSGNASSGFYGYAADPIDPCYGVRGESTSPAGIGVQGKALSDSGTSAGVQGWSSSPQGRAIEGINTAYGWAGYFSGDAYFSRNVGIGTETPSTDLDVDGTVRMTGFQLDASPTTGHVLTCGPSGVGTWQAPTGGGGTFDLPYEGTIDADTAAFKITNTGDSPGSHAISARINNPSSSSDAAAGYFSADNSNGHAIYATSDGAATIRAYHDGVSYAVYGHAASGANGGGRFTCAGNGSGVKAENSGTAGIALRAEATGVEGYAIDADSPYIGMTCSGGVVAAKFYGKTQVYAHGTSDMIFEVSNDGTTSVDVLHIMGGSDLAEAFDVNGTAEPGMVVEIDPDHPGKLRIARGAYNRRVAGVVSGANDLDVGMVLADLPGSDNSHPIALTGRVWVHCDATDHAIAPGDMLTTADRPGHAMVVTDFARAHGAVIGKAMTSLAKGETGMVLVLVNLQ